MLFEKDVVEASSFLNNAVILLALSSSTSTFDLLTRLLTFHFPTPDFNNREANSFSNDADIFLILFTSTSIIESVEAIPSTTHPRKIFPSLGSGVNLNRVPYGYSSDLFVFRISFMTSPSPDTLISTK